MANFTFNTEIITSLAAWHSDFSLLFFTVITNLGDFTAYLAILCVIYLAIGSNYFYSGIFQCFQCYIKNNLIAFIFIYRQVNIIRKSKTPKSRNA